MKSKDKMNRRAKIANLPSRVFAILFMAALILSVTACSRTETDNDRICKDLTSFKIEGDVLKTDIRISTGPLHLLDFSHHLLTAITSSQPIVAGYSDILYKKDSIIWFDYDSRQTTGILTGTMEHWTNDSSTVFAQKGNSLYQYEMDAAKYVNEWTLDIDGIEQITSMDADNMAIVTSNTFYVLNLPDNNVRKYENLHVENLITDQFSSGSLWYIESPTISPPDSSTVIGKIEFTGQDCKATTYSVESAGMCNGVMALNKSLLLKCSATISEFDKETLAFKCMYSTGGDPLYDLYARNRYAFYGNRCQRLDGNYENLFSITAPEYSQCICWTTSAKFDAVSGDLAVGYLNGWLSVMVIPFAQYEADLRDSTPYGNLGTKMDGLYRTK